ncbi:FadR/GntR family transcriptional regulator [Pseudomonas chlororaphis]|uniref:FadR/GntR family transcriptional regulator n=2 Tax=Pseudomonas chlororaphis TaxID=587753 RepID=UPI00087CAAAC|nr:FadR/GntR family transcriptional regulator [Pseudomonas chlororaphis]AZD93268.1 Transcriptional regulator NanR [Pseudomonas chlororaphis subsp. aureofaciens]AZD99569.1 Transcriptional regulator NanR [Pseudomonas chlororaphis subsp. aureofaciens]AZE24159.1 Transcriptional regulator NanR [Pseudomonas chlororaphis subsp. aureofaciens]WDG45880.1 FadR/GntR family transcriptional regulator [Pseudomonas chlororaphis]WDG58060.1 FadR/GntR family transcriptional regulator [Pseudomonas chlororaphis]
MKSNPSDMQSDFRPKQIYEQVADEIRAGIINGVYLPGSRLPSERDLAQRFMVSRPAVREAIGALQNEGMVVTRLGSGTYVAERVMEQPSMQGDSRSEADFSPNSVLEVRLLIEPAIARLAARRGKRNAQAEHYLAQMAGVKDVNDISQQALWSESDRLFHRQLAVMTEDALMVKIADEVSASMAQPLWNRLRDDGIYDANRIQLYVAEHRLIYEAIVTGDEEAAAFYVENHLKRVQRDINTRE